MRTIIKAASLTALAAAAAIGCAQQSDDQTVSGQVALNNFNSKVLGVRAVQGVDVVATTMVDSAGSFEIAIPTGERYRLEVVTENGAHAFSRRGQNGTRAIFFDVCAPGAPHDLGHVHSWDGEEGNGGEPGDPGDPGDPNDPWPDPWDDPEPHDCDDFPCDDPSDPNCEPPPPCDDPADPNCCEPGPDGTCWEPPPPPPCDDPADPNCCDPDGNCEPPPPPCDDPADPNCCGPDGNCEPPPPPPCDDPNNPSCCGPDGNCEPPPWPCEDPADPNCCPEPGPDGSCWPEPEEPVCEPDDPNGPTDRDLPPEPNECWDDDGVVCEYALPSFGCGG